jgi:hypothetical protein
MIDSQLGIHPNKYFSEDIKCFERKLDKKEPFTFSKFADGEWAVMQNKVLNNNEFQYVNSQEHVRARELLIDSFKYQHPNYHVGISCHCCQGTAFEDMQKFCEQPKERLTWANLWVNSNYDYYLRDIVPHFLQYNVVLVANENSTLDQLPFKPKFFCPISADAWVRNQDKIEDLKALIDGEKMEGWLFLFCCGPFGNILAHQLTEHSSKNTYLDVGSTLNPFLETEGFRRSYFAKHTQMIPCTWR